MYKIPLTNSPNQSFKCTIPVNGTNIPFKFSLWYNYKAGYWNISATNTTTGELYFNNIPLLTSKGKFADILNQFGYMHIGVCIMVSMEEDNGSAANEENIGKSYLMVWGDNDVVINE